MTKWNKKSRRKTSGGMKGKKSKKKRYQRMRDFMPAHVGETKRRTIDARGTNTKTFLMSAGEANVATSEGYKKAKISGVAENPADSQFVRRNILTKGALIDTDLGRARVTSRPGQDGVVNAVLVEKQESK